MKYMLLMTGTTAEWTGNMGALSPAEARAHFGFMQDMGEKLRATGELLDGQGLELPQLARIVRAAPDGGALVTDGPFPESKEFLAGYWLLEVASPARAVQIAAEISAAPGKAGAPMNFPIELRGVGEVPES